MKAKPVWRGTFLCIFLLFNAFENVFGTFLATYFRSERVTCNVYAQVSY